MSVTTMPQTEAEEASGGGRKKLVIIVVAVLLLGAVAYWFFLKPAGPPPAPVAGATMTMAAPIQVNLAAGHYLKVGIAVEMTDQAHEADPSKAVDALITTFSDLPLSEVTTAEQRDQLKEDLLTTLKKRYHGEVMEVFFTDFVTQ